MKSELKNIDPMQDVPGIFLAFFPSAQPGAFLLKEIEDYF